MSTQTNTKTTLAAGLPGLRKTLRGLAGMASALALAGAISVALQTRAEAAVITSQVGLPAPTGSTALGDTLTGGFTASRADLGWSHAYGAITDAILSVTLRIDLIDAEEPNRRLDLYAGTTTDGAFIGAAYGHNDGKPGPWLGLGDSADNVFAISSALYGDIADGTFDVFGDNQGMYVWGSNRALLTITTLDPELLDNDLEPSTVPELAGLGLTRRRRSA